MISRIMAEEINSIIKERIGHIENIVHLGDSSIENKAFEKLEIKGRGEILPYHIVKDVSDVSTPPMGRSQKQHNFIMDLNRRRR